MALPEGVLRRIPLGPQGGVSFRRLARSCGGGTSGGGGKSSLVLWAWMFLLFFFFIPTKSQKPKATEERVLYENPGSCERMRRVLCEALLSGDADGGVDVWRRWGDGRLGYGRGWLDRIGNVRTGGRFSHATAALTQSGRQSSHGEDH